MAAFVYLEKATNAGVFHCRGEIGPGDNPDGFARQMAQPRTGGSLRSFVTDGSEFGWKRDVAGAVELDAAGEPVREALRGVEVEAAGLRLRSIGELVEKGNEHSGPTLKILQRFEVVPDEAPAE